MSLLPATPKEVVLSLIAQQNTLPVPLTEKNLYFGNPHLDTDGLTTILPTTAMLGGEYEGYATFKYKRLDLSKIYDERPALYTVGAATLWEMLPIVNKYLGMNFTTNDVLDTNVAYIDGGAQVNINIAASPSSVGYTGSFVLRFFRQRVNFPDAVKNASLGVLSFPPNTVAGKRNIGMMMYDHDFTNDRNSIMTWGHAWFNFPAVKALMTDFGITDWPAPPVAGVTDYATKDYPGANTNFDRVVVQKAVVGVDYAGDALFHYNLS
jgi:hypothetical protein